MMSRFFRVIVIIGLFVSAGCASLEPLLASLVTPTPAPTRPSTPTPTAIATLTPQVEPGTPILRLWLPSQFDPSADNPPAHLLNQRLTQFESQHPGLKIEVRLKKADTDGEILNDLSVTSAAAPSVLPDLILLSRSDLESAAQKGLLHPIT